MEKIGQPLDKLENMVARALNLGDFPGGAVVKTLVVQWLRLHLPMQEVWIWSLVGELRDFFMPYSQKSKT